MIDNPKHSYQIVFGKISKYYHNLKKVLVAAHIDPIHVVYRYMNNVHSVHICRVCYVVVQCFDCLATMLLREGGVVKRIRQLVQHQGRDRMDLCWNYGFPISLLNFLYYQR